MSLAFRFFRPVSERWEPLYQNAPLAFAPGISMELVRGDLLSDSIALAGAWERPLTKHLVELAAKGGVFIDVGANLGYFSLLWAAASPKNRVFAFEASPRNIEMLRRNVERNHLTDQITIIPQAAGKEPGSLEFDVGPPDQLGWGGFASGSRKNAVAVDVVRGDEAVDVDGEIALLKVDIEGADTWALMGCDRLLREKRVRQVWFEQNKPRLQALNIGMRDAEDYLRSVSYKPAPMSDPEQILVDWSATPA
jgi:FkbM family methyltransferase